MRLLRPSPDRLTKTATAFESLPARYLVVPLLPFGLTILVIDTSYAVTAGDGVGLPLFPTLVYGVANVVVAVGLYTFVADDVWHASALFRRPSRGEVVAGGGAAVAGIVVGWPTTTILSDALGVSRYTIPSVTSPVGTASLFFGAIVVAPVVEEILFRGLLVGYLLDRGYGPAVTGGLSVAVFSGIHVFVGGVAGVLNALLLGALLTWLRLRFDNLVGAWLMHLVNNALEFGVAIALLPSLYAF
jgi:membrane protease YdiL (CAAX protease family)